MPLKALYLNTSLKKGGETSNTRALIGKSIEWMKQENVDTEVLRVADFHIIPGMSPDMGNGDEWPRIMDKVMQSDIIIMGTPIWNGEKSSLASVVMERLYAQSGETNEKGQAIYYNKVFGSLVTGNEDGAKAAGRSILFGMINIGFTVPPNVNAYWVGEAGPGPSYIEAGQESEFTKTNTKMMTYNVIHFARMLRKNPIPAEGNLM
ncbi:Multimeric flavodoxin WrbA [Lentibacillus persicus]|uniref:Multimeric flavodoxin WrbA n=1 Tax=Lentibacillus persicus TaxID=640948 RepID=A0A1I1RWC2_9BACI|nr:flavodoxin family protein [Lentibacillus persicus]SFD38561.1 Multimeric flavodoxin WrbA [Lentibacillus persicus]